MCSGPKIPPAPAPPTAIEPPKVRGEGIERAGQRARDKIGLGGRRSTILTSPIGDTSGTTTTKTLLGA